MVLPKPITAPPPKRLRHNFGPLPIDWGSQRCLRSIIPHDPNNPSVDPPLPGNLHSISPLLINEGDTDEYIRSRLCRHLWDLAVTTNEGYDETETAGPPGPWNLLVEDAGYNSSLDEKDKINTDSCDSPQKLPARARSLRLRKIAPEEYKELRPRKRASSAKLSTSVMKEEMNDDFIVMTGQPKMGAKKSSDLYGLFLGMSLSSVTTEGYKDDSLCKE